MDGMFFNSFLQENYLHFFTEIEEVSNASSYLSDSDIICCSGGTVRMYSEEVKNALTPYASLIATRGLLYTNTRPAPRKFQQFFKPQTTQLFKTKQNNRTLTNHFGKISNFEGTTHSSSVLNLEIFPYAQRIFNSKQSQSGPLFAFLRNFSTYSSFGHTVGDKPIIEKNDFGEVVEEIDQ